MNSRFILSNEDIIVLSDKTTNGGKGSGNFGHAGRIGQVGGSAPNDTITSEMRTKTFRKGDTIKATLENGDVVEGTIKDWADGKVLIVDKDGNEIPAPWDWRITMVKNVDAPDTKPSERRTAKQKEALEQVAEILKLQGKERTYFFNNCGEDTAIALVDELKKAQEDGVDFYGIELKRQSESGTRARVVAADRLSFEKYGDYDYHRELSLELSPKTTAGGKNLAESLKKQLDERETTTGDIAGVIRHEIGHIRVHNLVNRLFGSRYSADTFNDVERVIIDKAAKKVGITWSDIMADTTKSKMSRYGSTDRGEAIAESFANPNYSDFAKAITEVVKNFTMDDWINRYMNKVETYQDFQLCTGYPIWEDNEEHTL